MTTHSDNPWFAKTPGEIRAAIDARPENWQVIGLFRGLRFSRYEVSDKGGIRRVTGETHSKRLNNSGYPQTSITSDDGRRLHPTVHTLVLAKFDPRCSDGIPAGLESRHGPAGQQCNAWPENLDIGTPVENAADKYGPDGPPPLFPCKNAPRCRAEVPREGRRCPDCVVVVGLQAAALLNAGMNLQDAAEVFGYSRGDWTYKLAVKHGGYAGTREQAMTQRLTLVQRTRLRLRLRALLREAAGDAR